MSLYMAAKGKKTIQKKQRKIDILKKYQHLALNLNNISTSTGKLDSRKKILLVCEGEKSEPNYFNWLKSNWRVNAEIEIIGKCGDPLCVVQRAIYEKVKTNFFNKYDYIWAIFDRDNFDMGRISQAFDLALKNGIGVIFSNESFELWYLLHFDYIEGALGRYDICNKLSSRIGCKYIKGDDKIFKILYPLLTNAIKNALKLDKLNGLKKNNPYTGVYMLIENFAKFSMDSPPTKPILDNILLLMSPKNIKKK